MNKCMYKVNSKKNYNLLNTAISRTHTGEKPLPEKMSETVLEVGKEIEANAHMAERVRLLCYVYATKEQLETKCPHIKATWGKRCNKLIFMSSKESK